MNSINKLLMSVGIVIVLGTILTSFVSIPKELLVLSGLSVIVIIAVGLALKERKKKQEKKLAEEKTDKEKGKEETDGEEKAETEEKEETQKPEEKKEEEKKEKVWSLVGLIGSIVGLAWLGAILYILCPQQIQMMLRMDSRPFLMLALIGLALIGVATFKKKGLSWGLGVLMVLPILWIIVGGVYYSARSVKESVPQAIRIVSAPLKKEPYLERRLDFYTNIPFWTTYDIRFSKGDIVVFKDPKGEFTWDSQVDSTVGASGASWTPNQISRPQDFKVRDFNIVGLIGDIGDQTFGIGKGVSIEILKGGTVLKLAINERWKQYCWNDNSEGPISILVEVYRQQS